MCFYCICRPFVVVPLTSALAGSVESTTIRTNNVMPMSDVQLTPTTPVPSLTGDGSQQLQQVMTGAPLASTASTSASAPFITADDGGSVLKKIVSFTVDGSRFHSENATAKVSRPSYVPEKLNFSAYERFEGKLVLWIFFYSSIEMRSVFVQREKEKWSLFHFQRICGVWSMNSDTVCGPSLLKCQKKKNE